MNNLTFEQRILGQFGKLTIEQEKDITLFYAEIGGQLDKFLADEAAVLAKLLHQITPDAPDAKTIEEWFRGELGRQANCDQQREPARVLVQELRQGPGPR